MSKIFVVGSINVDYVMEITHLPLLGETLPSQSFLMNFGGKGANQAVALAKQNEEVYLIGCVGQDTMGKDSIQSLNQYGVHTDFIKTIEHQNTGLAFILVENHNNRILLHAGANQNIQKQQVLEALSLAKPNDYLLVQLETNLDMVYFAIHEAQKRKMNVVFNPAPVQSIDMEILDFIDILIVNEIECEMLLHCKYDQKEQVQSFINKHQIAYFIVTLGEKGAMVYHQQDVTSYPAHAVKVVDTTAAGDTFIGAFLSEWIRTANLSQSMQYAIVASALTCTHIGAQKSIQSREEVQNYLKVHF